MVSTIDAEAILSTLWDWRIETRDLETWISWRRTISLHVDQPWWWGILSHAQSLNASSITEVLDVKTAEGHLLAIAVDFNKVNITEINSGIWC